MEEQQKLEWEKLRHEIEKRNTSVRNGRIHKRSKKKKKFRNDKARPKTKANKPNEYCLKKREGEKRKEMEKQ